MLSLSPRTGPRQLALKLERQAEAEDIQVLAELDHRSRDLQNRSPVRVQESVHDASGDVDPLRERDRHAAGNRVLVDGWNLDVQKRRGFRNRIAVQAEPRLDGDHLVDLPLPPESERP